MPGEAGTSRRVLIGLEAEIQHGVRMVAEAHALSYFETDASLTIGSVPTSVKPHAFADPASTYPTIFDCMSEHGMIEDRIYRFVVEDLRWEEDAGELTYDTPLIDGAMDSLGIVKTISFLESDFGITVNEDEISPANFETVHALAEFVRRKGGTTP